MGSQPKVFGDRIRQAREARAMTKVTLGELVKVSSTTIGNYETGRSDVPAEKIRDIATYLRQPLDFFLVPPIRDEGFAEPVQFRSLRIAHRTKAPLLTRLTWLEELATLFDRHVSLPTVNFPEPAVRTVSRRLSAEEIEEYALRVRELWQLRPGPIRDLVFAAESNGVIVQAFSFEPETIDGVSRWMKDLERPLVILNSVRANMVRTRFSLAHELAHLLLHSRLQDTDRVAIGLKVLEDEANQLASALLMPAETWELEARRTRHLSAFEALKLRWKVSIKAMLYRSKSLGLLQPERYVQLMKQYSSRGWNQGEPFDRQWAPEVPALLRESAELLAASSISGKVLQELLPLDDCDLEDLVGTNVFREDSAILGLEVRHAGYERGERAREQTRDDLAKRLN